MSTPDPSETFRQEAQELLDQLEHALLDLEAAPASADHIDAAFRALHTIKGSGSMFGFEPVAAFTHHVETAFDLVRKGKVAPSRELIAVALSAKDHIRRLIEQPGADPAAGEAILSQLETVVSGSAAAPADPAAAPDAITAWRVRFRLPQNALTNGTNPLLLLDELRGLGEATVVAQLDDVPPLETIDPQACYVGWDVVLTTARPRADIEQVFLFVFDDAEIKIEPIAPSEAPKKIGEILVERGDVNPQSLDAALARQEPVGQILVKSGEVSQEKVAAALAEQRHMRAETNSAAAPNNKGAGSIRVPAERLDELMDRVGELVIAQSRLRQIAAASLDPQVKSVAEEIERLSLELRDTTMGVRMLPIESLFGRFRRIIHDLSRDLGKGIELVTAGGETELDKTVIERLNDPLIHMIRNAADHGLESPEARAAAGKPPEGHISLTARHAGAEVLISIADDGRGLDRARIQARAEEQGLLAPGAKLADGELFQLIFQPGFSTAREVTSLSGRGVGMDVVKRTIDALRGSIDVASEPGRGTTVTLRLPLTLAIIDGLLVRIGSGRYVIPLAAVEECVELSAEEDARSRGRNFLSLRGDLVPFLRLRELFAASAPPDRYQKVVVVSSGDLRLGLVVDQVIGEYQTVIKTLSKLHADARMFSGATILGDGTVALILEIPHLVEYGQVHEERLKAAG